VASRIVAALAAAGYGIVPANGMEDTALGPQPFDKLTREMRPQDPFGDGRDWTFRTGEHGGDEPDNMPQTIKASDAAGRLGDLCPAHSRREDRSPAAVSRDRKLEQRRDQTALPQPQRGHLVPCARSRDGHSLCPAPGDAVLDNRDRPPPRQFLGVVDLAQVQHMPLHHAPTGDPRVLDNAPIAVLLAILPADFAAQDHDGRQLSAHWRPGE
jgi:hypothetical protein